MAKRHRSRSKNEKRHRLCLCFVQPGPDCSRKIAAILIGGKEQMSIILARLLTLLLTTGLSPVFWSSPEALASGNVVRPQTGQVPIISNGKIPQPPDKKQRTFIFKEDLTIGVREGDENYMFGERVYFNVDKDGNIFVTDWDRKRIQKYGPDGKYLLTIGREGQGPGEFRNVWEPEFDKGGNLYVVDISQKRISFFSRDGGYLKQIGFPQTNVSSSLYLNSRGHFLLAADETKAEGEDGVRWETTVGLYDDKFQPVEVFHRENHEIKTPGGREEDSIAQSWAAGMSDTAFKPAPHYLLAPNDEIFFGYSNSYEINVYSPEGKLVRIIRKDYDPATVTAKDKEQYEKVQGAEFLRFLPAQLDNAKKKALKLIRYPKYKPAYQDFTPADNGWLFVIVDSGENGATILDVFDAQGNYIARTEAPIPSEMLRFKKGKAYAIATEDSYKFVKRFSYTVREK